MNVFDASWMSAMLYTPKRIEFSHHLISTCVSMLCQWARLGTGAAPSKPLRDTGERERVGLGLSSNLSPLSRGWQQCAMAATVAVRADRRVDRKSCGPSGVAKVRAVPLDWGSKAGWRTHAVMGTITTVGADNKFCNLRTGRNF